MPRSLFERFAGTILALRADLSVHALRNASFYPPSSVLLLDCQFDVKHEPEDAACHERRLNSSLARLHVDMGGLCSPDRISVGLDLVVLTVVFYLAQ